MRSVTWLWSRSLKMGKDRLSEKKVGMVRARKCEYGSLEGQLQGFAPSRREKMERDARSREEYRSSANLRWTDPVGRNDAG